MLFRSSVAFLRGCLVRDRKRRDLRSLANFHKGVNFLEPILELDDTVAEFRTVDDHFAIGIVEDVEDLLGDIAVIDVHMDQAPLEAGRSEEHTSELQSLMRISDAAICLQKKN